MQNITFQIPDDLYEDFMLYCKLTGQNPDVVGQSIITQCVSHYRNDNGRIQPKHGFFYENRNPVKQKAWENEKHSEPLPDVKKECLILYDTSIFGHPYKTILVDGQFMKVPAEEVEEIADRSET